MKKVNFIVTEENHNIRLDRLLRRTFPSISQASIEKSLRKKLIKLNNKKSKSSTRVAIGDEIILADIILNNINKKSPKKIIQILSSDIEQLKEAIIYKDDDIIVLNKQSGLAVQGGSKIVKNIDVILEYLKFEYSERPKLVHRLDKDTSGVLLIARKTHIAAKLSEMFKNKTIEKFYWAIVKGNPKKTEGKITNMIYNKNKNPLDKSKNPKEAITYFKTLNYIHDTISLLEMNPITGRTHQLRIHALDLGTPIIGDKKYGIDNKIEGIDYKLHLHARKLIIRNFNGRDLEFVAPLPDHMKKTFDHFGLNS